MERRGNAFMESEDQTVISKRKSPSPPPPASFRPLEVGASLEGEQLGHFLLEEFVGGGGMGAVFRGLDTTLGRVVAVKVVSNKSTDEDTLKRFRNEAQSAARLDHPNIARAYYVGEDKGWNYIVFEFIEGVNVRDLVEHGGLCSEAHTVSYGLQITDALAHAAERDVVHRDIKPSNILVMPDGRAKLVDMGLARLHQVDAPANDLTATGVTLGTFDYISPEQARDPRSADVRSDLYSLGCTLYYMLTGMPPFPEGTVLQKLLSHSSEPPPNPRELRPELNEDIATVVLKLMAKLPNQRYQSPNELMSDLIVLADRRGLSGVSQAVSRTRPQRTSWQERAISQLPWLVPALVLLIAGGVMQSRWQSIGDENANFVLPRLLPPAKPRVQPPPSQDEQKAPGAPSRLSPDNKGEEPGSASRDDARMLPSTATDALDARDAAGPIPNSQEDRPRRPPVSTDHRPPQPPGTVADVIPAAVPLVEAVEEKPRKIVVAITPQPASETEIVLPTLAAALQFAADEVDIATIELRVDRLEVSSLTFDLRRSLTIRAASDYRPEIVFRPDAGELLPDRRMFKLLGGHDISFVGIDFRMEMPYEPAPSCTMFHLNQVNSIALSRCSLTMRNEFGSNAFFAVQGPRLSSTIDGEREMAEATSPSIDLERTIVRGQAALVRANQGLPFWLTWNQGLFTSTERMLEVGGLLEKSHAEVVNVTLTNVTASMKLGLCRVRVDDMGPYLPAVDIRCYNSVLTHDPSWPLVEHIGVASLEEASNRFKYGGEDNYYELTQLRWRVQSADGDTFEFLWRDREFSWYEERFAERVVRWEDAYLKRPAVTEQTPAHFRLVGPQRRLAGFDEEQIPGMKEEG